MPAIYRIRIQMPAETPQLPSRRLRRAGRISVPVLPRPHVEPRASSTGRLTSPARRMLCDFASLRSKTTAVRIIPSQRTCGPSWVSHRRSSIPGNGGVPCTHTSTTRSKTTPFRPMRKRRRGYPSETKVKRGVRIVHGDKLLEEKLGRNDLCPCGSGRRFKKCCLRKGLF